MTIINNKIVQDLLPIIEANINKCIENNHLPVEYVIDPLVSVTVYGGYNPHTKLTQIQVMMFDSYVLTTTHKADDKYKMSVETKALVFDNIIKNSILTACREINFYGDLSDLLAGSTSAKAVVHPIGLEIKYSSEDDSQVFMAEYNGKVLFAREEAINVDFGIGHDMLTTNDDLHYAVNKLVKHIVQTTDFEFNV